MIPQLRERFGRLDAATLADRFEAEGLPFARIEKPEDLLHDPHLLASGGLQPMKLPDGERAGEEALVALLPLRMGGERLGVRADAPRFAAQVLVGVGFAHQQVLQSVGYTVSEVESMADSGAVATAQ